MTRPFTWHPPDKLYPRDWKLCKCFIKISRHMVWGRNVTAGSWVLFRVCQCEENASIKSELNLFFVSPHETWWEIFCGQFRRTVRRNIFTQITISHFHQKLFKICSSEKWTGIYSIESPQATGKLQLLTIKLQSQAENKKYDQSISRRVFIRRFLHTERERDKWIIHNTFSK